MTETKITTDETNGSIITKRQNDTTNTIVGNVRVETGWGVMQFGTASAGISEAVAFQTAFTTVPIVILTYAGDHGSSTARGSGGNTVKGAISQKVYGESTTGFTVHVHSADGTQWGASNTVFYNWMAVGN